MAMPLDISIQTKQNDAHLNTRRINIVRPHCNKKSNMLEHLATISVKFILFREKTTKRIHQ